MEIYEIIKLDENSNEIANLVNEISNIYVCGIDTIANILAIEKFPIANRRIAIKNIMKFLAYVDSQMKKNNNTILPIPQNILIEFFSKNQYVEYMKLLASLKIMTAVSYQNGTFYSKEEKKSKQYRIHNKFINEDLALLIINDKKEIEISIEGTYDKKFVNAITKIEVDLKFAVIDELKNKQSNNSLRCRLSILFGLYGKRWMKKGQNVDRIYHSLSNLSRISRKHIHIKGKKFHNIDIKNCQPLLLCYLLLQNGLEIDENYKKDCENGSLYERFIDNYTSRDEVKVMLYKSIYFDFKPGNEIAEKFKNLYPATYKSLEIISKDGNKLAGKLQNIEASIFNDLVPAKSRYFFTLFDAIYFLDGNDIIQLCDDINEKFLEFGIKPKLEING